MLWVDRFGNCQLNVGPDDLGSRVDAPDVWMLRIGDEHRVARSAGAYAELGTGVVGLVLDSHGMYTLALDKHSAAAELRLAAGDAVVIAPLDDAGAVQTGVTTPVGLQRRR